MGGGGEDTVNCMDAGPAFCNDDCGSWSRTGGAGSAEAPVETLSELESASEAPSNVQTHYFMDVPNSEESSMEKNEQHVQIDPELRTQL
jgi:hypothetical protein